MVFEHVFDNTFSVETSRKDVWGIIVIKLFTWKCLEDQKVQHKKTAQSVAIDSHSVRRNAKVMEPKENTLTKQTIYW